MTGVEPHLCKVHEMFEACVEVSFFSKRDNLVEMRVVDVSVYTEESFEDLFHDWLKILGEWNVCIENCESM